MKILKIHSHYGPGGRNCVCCGPGPNQRTKHDRMVKRRERAQARKDIQKSLQEITDQD